MDLKIIKTPSPSRDKFKDFPMYKRKRFLKFLGFVLLGSLAVFIIIFLIQVKIFKREAAEAAIKRECKAEVIKEIVEKGRSLRWVNYKAGEPFNLQFSYPENWHILVNTDPDRPVSQYAKATIILSDKPIEIGEKFLNYPLIIEISNQSLTYKERIFEEGAEEKEKKSIDGVTAVQFRGVNTDLHSRYQALVFYKDKRVFVIFGLLNLGYNDYEEIFERVVQSIKFEE